MHNIEKMYNNKQQYEQKKTSAVYILLKIYNKNKFQHFVSFFLFLFSTKVENQHRQKLNSRENIIEEANKKKIIQQEYRETRNQMQKGKI